VQTIDNVTGLSTIKRATGTVETTKIEDGKILTAVAYGTDGQFGTETTERNSTTGSWNTKTVTAAGDMKPIVDEIGVYNNYLTEYMTIKTNVQQKLFVSLLELEYTTNTYMSSARILTDSVNDDGTVYSALVKW
jgi:hypothetical protein